MRPKLLIFALLSLLAYSVFVAPTFAQTFYPDLCPNKDGAYYRNLFPRFRGGNFRLVLGDWTTGKDVHVLAEQLPDRFTFSWSPDCHYLVGYSLGYGQIDAPCLFIWDAPTGEVKFTSDGWCDDYLLSYPLTRWRTDSTAVLLSVWIADDNDFDHGLARIIWYPETGERVKLLQQAKSIMPTFSQTYWDDARGWLWGNSYYGVAAFDTHTGVQVISFENLPPSNQRRRGACTWHFTFSPNNTHIILNGQNSEDHYTCPAMSVYDIASGAGVAVNVELNGAGVVGLSPDNRYVVMGYTALRVWDLNNLPEKVEDRLPIYRINAGGFIDAVRFVDNTTVEITSGGGTSLWNVSTGQRVP